MAAPTNVYAFELDIAIAAADRWKARSIDDAAFTDAVRRRQYRKLDSPERLAKRANRLLSRQRGASTSSKERVPAEFEALIRDVAAPVVTADKATDELLERVIGETRDFLFIDFLSRAVSACKSVARIVTKFDNSGRVSYGTGFMVSPRLLMTNYHVLGNELDASRSEAEFDYHRNSDGTPAAIRRFRLDPATFFLNDKDLDFAIVAVSASGNGRPLGEFGWCPLIKEEGKVVIGEPINIIQHPLGDFKQVVIRENLLTDLANQFAHYKADTEPGSSGSPVFNDQWEVVALHHSGVPKRNDAGDLLATDGRVWKKGDDPIRLAWVANEGIRVSRLVEFLANAGVRSHEEALLKELLNAKPPENRELEEISTRPRSIAGRTRTRRDIEDDSDFDRPSTAGSSASLTVPLHITFSIGASQAGRVGVGDGDSVQTVAGDQGILEKVEPDPGDPDYENRPGYNPEFLGFDAPFPKLTSESRPDAYPIPGLSGASRYELKYHHYSVIFNKTRKLAFVAGVNYDPMAAVQYKRQGSDKWYYDPRVQPEDELQAGEDLYAGNPFDRGHLVRRADAAWGRTEKQAKLANDDTFHFTNCSPQHEITNQGIVKRAPKGLKLWGKLEDHISKQGTENARKLSIFNGPVFRTTDRRYRGVKIPKEFWKVVVFESDSAEPCAAAFLLTQASLIQGVQEEFSVGEYKAVQVRVADLETKTKLDFGPFRDWDVIGIEEFEESLVEDAPARILESLADVVL